jgi:hypothetical protein
MSVDVSEDLRELGVNNLGFPGYHFIIVFPISRVS